MSLKKLFLVVLVVVWVVQGSLFPLITSRIEGQVLDKDTGEPVSSAWVSLFFCNDMDSDVCIALGERETDLNGFFRFDDLKYGPYFMVVVHRDYFSFGPLDEAIVDRLPGHTKLELEGEYVFDDKVFHNFFPSVPERNFYLEEGQIKHLKIEIEKAAKLEIHLKVKKPTGIEMYHGRTFNGMDFENGVYINSRVEEGTTDIWIQPYGYADIIKEGITVVKGQVTVVECLMDYTQGQVIHGVIRLQGRPEPGLNLSLTSVNKVPNSDNYECVEAKSGVKGNGGEYWIGGMNPGEYILSVDNFKKRININPNDKIELNIDLE